MITKTITILLSLVACSECAHVYSSFWAPLSDPRILNYRVDAPFQPDSGNGARELYQRRYGYRGENLVADLGNGKGPGDQSGDSKMAGDVRFYYTYPGAAAYNQLQ